MNKIYQFTILLVFVIGIFSCSRISEGSRRNAEKIKLSTTALYETTPMPQVNNEDAADDPAIWINSTNTDESRIIGTDKKGGLAVYNLRGEQLYYYPDGMMNNVDLRYNFVLGQDTIDIVTCSNRSTHSLSIYKISLDGQLTSIASRTINSFMTDEVYGLCMYKSPASGKFFVFINSKAGEVEQWELIPADSLVDARMVRNFHLDSQVEGMVADDEARTLFIGEEIKGIWTIDAEPESCFEKTRIDLSSEFDNKNICYDIEGLAIYSLGNGAGYLLASSQGNYSYALFERQKPYKYIGNFRILGDLVDEVEETDGVEICSVCLNTDFAHGLLVLQDGYNYDKEKLMAQNFKLVRWEDVAALFSPALKMN